MLVAHVLAALITAAPVGTAVTLDKDVVDAVGEQQVVLKVPVAGMVHVEVDSAVGTACTFVDHLRGPFLHNGEVGKQSCVVDTLLDAGIYKLRLHSPPAADGTTTKKKSKKAATTTPQAKLKVAAFVDVERDIDGVAPPLAITPGTTLKKTLPAGTQLVRWLRVPDNAEVVLDVVGRTTGDVRLWRDGRFVTDTRFTTSVVRGESGRPRWRHRLQSTIEAGEYAVVVAAANPQRFATGSDDDSVAITFDAPFLSSTGSGEVVVPAHGYSLFGSRGATATVVVDGKVGSATGDVVLTGTTVVRRGNRVMRGRDTRSCTIAAKAVTRGCSVALPHSDDLVGVSWELTAPANTRATVATFDARKSNVGLLNVDDGSVEHRFDIGSSEQVGSIAVSVLPADLDAPPTACVLEQLNDRGEALRVVASDAPKVSWTTPWQRRFNVDGNSTTLWFQIERAGVYGFTSDKILAAGCDVFTVDGTSRKRVGGADVGKGCSISTTLPAGRIEVVLRSGPGIERLRIAQLGTGVLAGDVDSAGKTGCVLSASTPLPQGNWRVRLANDANKKSGVVVVADLGRIGAAAMSTPLTIEPGASLAVPLGKGPAVVVGRLGAERPGCAIDGAALPSCIAPSRTTTATLTLTNTTSSPLPVMLAPQVSTAAALTAPDQPFSPSAPALTTLAAGTTRWFDLDTTTTRSFLVDVKSAGLYDVQTEGLLSTSCAVRTATTTSLFDGSTNGRGRNCRVEAWLKPGQYLVDVKGMGRSFGRAGLSVVARSVVDSGALALGDERFVAVAANQLVTHGIALKNDGVYDVSVQAADADLRCRLDDDDGWPVLPVPHACTLAEQPLSAGRYKLVVLPLGVDSRRAVKAAIHDDSERVVLRGAGVRALPLNTATYAELGATGSDRYRFALSASGDYGVVLTNGMLGRLRRVVDGKVGDVVHTIAPSGGSAFSVRSSDEDGDSGDEDGEYSDDSSDSEDESGNDEGGYDESPSYESDESYSERAASASRASLQAAAVHRPPPGAPGEHVFLDAGTWELTTEHARGDVGITYTVGVHTEVLVPGARLTVNVPAVIDVQAPDTDDAGLVRLKTRGATDVACRLVDDTGVVVASSRSSGDDWNCALATPLDSARSYRLFIDAEVLVTGPTEVSAEFLAAKSTGPLEDGNAFRVVGKVARADVVPVAGKVTSIDLVASDGTFSCALFDHDGRVVDSAIAVKRCPLLAWGNGDARPFSLLMWTADRPASVKARVVAVSPSGKGPFGYGSVDGDRVVEVSIPRAGRYQMAKNARCLSKSARGALVPCPGSVALDPAVDGATLLIGAGRGEKADVAFDEIVGAPMNAGFDARRVGAHHDVERQHTDDKRLHLVEVVAAAGASGAVACSIDGGVAVRDRRRCVAASSLGTDSLLRIWTKAGADVDVTVRRRALAMPSTSTALSSSTTLNGTQRFALDNGGFRLDAALPAGAAAVLVDDAGKAIDVCAPSTVLARCVLRGRGGESLVVDGVGAARFDLMRLDTVVDVAHALRELREREAPRAGRERLQVAAADSDRVVVVEGRAILGCRRFDGDGDVREGCSFTLPAKHNVDVEVEHKAGPWRAFLAPAGAVNTARIGALPTTTATTTATALTAMKTAALSGTKAQLRAVTLTTPAMLRLRADSGVCGVVRTASTGVVGGVVASSGDGDGCDTVVALPAGTHHVVVRPFGDSALRGGVVVTTAPIATLVEGVNSEVLLLPGERTMLRVPLEKDGELGIGVQVDAEVLRCALLDTVGVVVADGCQIFGRFKKGSYLLRVGVDADDAPRRFKPVVFGLKGAEIDVPDSFLKDFFRRVPPPASSSSSASSASSEVR